jgi:hypothetical protein
VRNVKRVLSLAKNSDGEIRVNKEMALVSAAFLGYLSVVKCLVVNGANINAYNNLALREARAQGHSKVVDYIIGCMIQQIVKCGGQ